MYGAPIKYNLEGLKTLLKAENKLLQIHIKKRMFDKAEQDRTEIRFTKLLITECECS